MDSNAGLNTPLSLRLILLTIFNIAVCGAIITFCFYFAHYFTFDIFKRINNESYFVEASKFGAFIAIGGVGVFIFMLMFILRLFNKLTERMNVILGKGFTYTGILALVCTFIMWPVVNHQLDKHNYSYCFHYTGSNMFSPPVYVKHPSYCHKGARGVTKELFAWFDEQEAAGVELKPIEVQQKIQELKQEKGTDW